MRERIKWLISSILTLAIGALLLYFYFSTEQPIAKVLLYLASMCLITIGTNQFAFFFESLLRKIDEPRTPFSEIFFWLIPCLFLLYQFYAVDNFILKIFLLIFIIIFAFVFTFALVAAVADSTLAKKRINILAALVLLFLSIFGLSYAARSTEVLLFFPLISILSYTDYVRVNYIIKNSQPGRNGANKRRSTKLHKLSPISLGTLIRKTYLVTSLLTFLLYIIFFFYAKEISSLPETISNLYTVSLTLYTFILSIITAFAILVLHPRISKKRTKETRRALLGLAQMCLVFILFSLFGVLMGIGMDSSMFATGTTPSDIFISGKAAILLQVLLFEFVILSFPPAFMYLYAMLKGFLYQGE